MSQNSNTTEPQTSDPIHLEDRNTDGVRLFSPTAARNRGPIADILRDKFGRGARVLEIASGTGEHALHMCQTRNDIIWQPSDPDAASRASQNSWARECPGQMLPSLPLDTTRENWWETVGEFDAIYCANMIHIAPWEAALGLARGAAHILGHNGHVILYGPFNEGEATAASNIAFDVSLKSRNPAWGVRSLDLVKHMFADAGFNMDARINMPKENRLLIFSR